MEWQLLALEDFDHIITIVLLVVSVYYAYMLARVTTHQFWNLIVIALALRALSSVLVIFENAQGSILPLLNELLILLAGISMASAFVYLWIHERRRGVI